MARFLDTTRYVYEVGRSPRLVLEYDKTKPVQDRQPRLDREGRRQWDIQLVEFGEDGATTLEVRLAFEIAVAQRDLVTVEGLSMDTWTGDDGSTRVIHRANAIKPVTQRADKAAA
jgi:hypothetical protein